MDIHLFDHPVANRRLWPLTAFRPVADLRLGILRLSDKWQQYTRIQASHLCADNLQALFPLGKKESDQLVIQGNTLPTRQLADWLLALPDDCVAVDDQGEWIGFKTRGGAPDYLDLSEGDAGIPAVLSHLKPLTCPFPVSRLLQSWEIFQMNATELERDFELLTIGRSGFHPSATNLILGNRFFIEEGAKMEGVTINSLTGPVYIGRDTEIMEGSVIRGPFALCDHALVKMAAKIYGPTTIGPGCKVGGEIQNVVFQANSNKAHDGYLGNSAIGEWCNLGADTNSSNLKNTYQEVKLWDYAKGGFVATGSLFCGLVMGDHAKCGINTMFNTGTVVGVGANVFGSGYPRPFIPDFAWGGASGFTTHSMRAFLDTARIVMDRRGQVLTPAHEHLYRTVFEQTAEYRNWEKN